MLKVVGSEICIKTSSLLVSLLTFLSYLHPWSDSVIMPPPLIGGTLSDDAVWRLYSLSVAYIVPKSRTERPRKTKIGTEIAHVTGDSDTTFKLKRSTTPGRFTHRSVGASGGCSCGRGNVMAVRNCCYVTVWEALRRPGGGEGWGHIVAPERLQLVYGTLKIEYITLHYYSLRSNM